MDKNMLKGVGIGVCAAVLIHASGMVEASGQALKVILKTAAGGLNRRNGPRITG